MQDALQIMNQLTSSESRVKLPEQIAQELLINQIIEISPSDDQVLAPKARIMLAKSPIEQPSYQTKRTSCHYLLQRLLCSISTTYRNFWELKYSASGAPALAAIGTRRLYVSMARSSDWLAAGVSYEAGIGVDIECFKPRSNCSEMADFLNWNIPVGDIHDFYSKWTLWEASAKCVEGSVLMRNNLGFAKLCHVDTHDRVGRSGQWNGLHDCLYEKVFYAIALQCENNTDLSHQILCPEKAEPWSVSNSHQSTRPRRVE
jgi:phosphopantetheinyl transferase